MKHPEGKYAWTVKVGEKGQFVIPKEAQFCRIKLINLFLLQRRKPALHPCIIPRFILSGTNGTA